MLCGDQHITDSPPTPADRVPPPARLCVPPHTARTLRHLLTSCTEHRATLADHGWIVAATYATDVTSSADHRSRSPVCIRDPTVRAAVTRDLRDNQGSCSYGSPSDDVPDIARTDQEGGGDTLLTFRAHPDVGSSGGQVGNLSGDHDHERGSARGIDGTGGRPSRFRRPDHRDRSLFTGVIPAGLFTIGNACALDRSSGLVGSLDALGAASEFWQCRRHRPRWSTRVIHPPFRQR